MAKSKSKKHSKKGNQNHHHHQHQQPVQEKVIVKRKSGCFLALLLLIVIIALIIWLLKHFDIGFFGKDGSGDSDGKKNDTSQSESLDDNSEDASIDKNIDDNTEKIVDITVKGTQYYYNDGKTEIQNFIDEVKNMEGAVTVRITDENAYVEYVEALIEALENPENNIPYIEASADSENE